MRIALAAVVLAALTATAAWAAQPGPGTSTGTGTVFFPNPVAQLRNESLTDQKDENYAALRPAYKTVTLTDLDGSGFLRGRWANVVSETGNAAYSPTNTFAYNRSQDEFEQVMAYYWVTQAQLYIQRLGFGSTRRPSTPSPRTSGSTSTEPITRSGPTIRRTRSGSARVVSTTRRTRR
jgi:hypothetical protein